MEPRLVMLETTMRRVARAGLPLLMITLGEVLGPAATPLAAQAPGEEQEPASVEGEEPIEWNFRPKPAASAVTDASLQERWAAPFAVISQGRPAPRAPREVVVLRDSVAARRVAVAQAATGQSVAEVTLEEDGAASAPAAEEAVGAAAGSADAAPRRHTVIRGDTLFGIARRYGVSAAAIRSANRLQDDVVRLGQTLVIPREEASR